MYNELWEKRFSELKEYFNQTGEDHSTLKRKGYRTLANWVRTQRYFCRKGKLLPDRVRQLDGIGFIWNPKEHRLEKRVNFLVEGLEKNEPGLFATDLKTESRTKTEIAKIRQQYRNATLPDWCIDKLNKVGFQWDVKAGTFEGYLERLEKYVEQHGNANVPRYNKPDQLLANWVNRTRRAKKIGNLPQKKIAALDKIGFIWNPGDQIWNSKFGQFSCLLVSKTASELSVQEKRLFKYWFPRQIKKMRKGKLNREKEILIGDLPLDGLTDMPRNRRRG